MEGWLTAKLENMERINLIRTLENLSQWAWLDIYQAIC
jgi:hypothetical protein